MSFNDQSIGKYYANPQRYENIKYRRCGKSGILLPLISVG
ncbi:MAG TPA: L-glyceraldehyde 3-phosphate reductase, partial [Bacteroidetes bacterium]|nr:L-glyceraldehyde 3-phosphate reductase [Bacteroidota bacterium]